jgi:hypothetical protein
MAVDITITLSDAEYYAMQLIAYDPQEWVENVAQVRARAAIEEIANEIVQEKLAAGEAIQGTKEDLVLNSGRKTAKQLTDEADALGGPPQ